MKKIRVAINGYGRIGRNILRASFERGYDDIEVVAFNNRGGLDGHAHLTKYDTIHGRFGRHVSFDKQHLIVEDKKIVHFSQPDPSKIPWRDVGVDVVLECTGHFLDRQSCQAHLEGGAKKVLISAPAKGDIDATIVYGVNHHKLQASHQVVSNASCTTNCLASMLAPIVEEVGITRGTMTSIHAYTNDQKLIDNRHADLRRARAAACSIIPTKTGAASSIGLVIPSLKGKLDGFALRVPTPNVSLVDVVFEPENKTNLSHIHRMIQSASQNEMKGVLAYCDEPLVSTDHNHTPYSCVFDATLSQHIDGLFKICGWYDNEWGFSVRMLDVARIMAAL